MLLLRYRSSAFPAKSCHLIFRLFAKTSKSSVSSAFQLSNFPNSVPRKILGFLHVPSFFSLSHSRSSIRSTADDKSARHIRLFRPWKTFPLCLYHANNRSDESKPRAESRHRDIDRSARHALKTNKSSKDICEGENQSWARNCVASHNQLVSGKANNFLSTRTIVRAGVLRLSSFLVSSIRD